jgi:glutamate formiminotransferase/formiminotetrahydrofolate cyclodeaminase
MRLTERMVKDLVESFSAPTPTPGGGSASALTAGLGASLLLMVARMPKSRHNSADEREALGRAGASLTVLRDALIQLVDRDSEAYDAVVAAYRLPKAGEAERTRRTEAIAAALEHATDVPLEIMRTSADVLAEGELVARYGNRAAASDVGVALELTAAGLRGAALNVHTNLEGLKDRRYVDRVADTAARMAERAEGSRRRATELLKG